MDLSDWLGWFSLDKDQTGCILLSPEQGFSPSMAYANRGFYPETTAGVVVSVGG
jgi:hypothetical protein